MSVTKPYMTSNDLIEAVKRKIAIPIYQTTFTEEDILKFANEEMLLSQVPSVLAYHEEYFVHRHKVPLSNNKSRYAIPKRAIGMRLRDLMWSDQNDNLYEMTRIDAEDKAFFQRNIGANQAIHKFYLEGNDVVLTPLIVAEPTGSLNFYIYLRPNQLVKNDRAAIISSIVDTPSSYRLNVNQNATYIDTATDTINLSGHPFADGHIVTLQTTDTMPAGLSNNTVYYVVSSVANTSFKLSTSFNGSAVDITTVGSGILTVLQSKDMRISTTHPFVAIAPANTLTFERHDFKNNDKVVLSSTSSLPAPLQTNTIYYVVNRTTTTIQLSTVPNGTPIDLTSIGDGTITVDGDLTQYNFESNVSSGVFSESALMDILQTESGHRTRVMDLVLSAGALGTNYMIFPKAQVSDDIEVGDYICNAGEAIIPQVPSDLHNGLAERVCSRILAAQGDKEGLELNGAKLAEISQREGTLLDNRVDGAPHKINARHSILRYLKIGHNRRRL